MADLGEILEGHRSAIVGIGRSQVFLRSARLPKAAQEDLQRILSVQLDQYFPLPADQLSFDFVQTADQTSEGCLTVVAAMRADDLRNLRAALKQAGLRATRIVPISLAAPAVVSRAGLTDAIVVEREAAGLALDVVQNGIVRSSRVTSASANAAGEVQRTAASARAPEIAAIAVGSVELPGAKPGLDTTLSQLHTAPPFYFELAEDRLHAAKKRADARNRMAGLLLTTALLLFAVVWSGRQDQATKAGRAQGAITRQMTVTQSIVNTESTNAAKLIAVDAALDRAYKPAQPLSDIAALVTDALPPGAWLTGLTLERGKPLDIRGATKNADDVAKFVDNLGASSRFRDVKLVFANSALIGKIPVVQFSVSATAVGNLPLPTQDRKTVGKKLSSSTSSTATGGTQ